MIIYADILFFINAVVTYFLLICCALVLKTPFKRLRLLAASFLGGIYALSILIPNVLFSFILKLPVCLVLILLAFGKMNVRLVLIHLLLFLFFNVVYGGLILLLSLANERLFYSNVFVTYLNVTPIMLVIALVVFYFLIRLFMRLNRKKRLHRESYRVTLYFQQKQYRLYGFCDTGNHLFEPFSALPVCIVKKGIIEDFEKEQIKRIIPYSTLSENGILTAVKAEVIIDLEHNNSRQKQPVYICENEASFRDMQYSIILHPKLFER